MINILPPEVYNRIAAGEVVDRPYSVVKELVENAIDAGATEITVEAESGGKKLIRVTDNGCGIHKEDLKAAFLPHATSKLKTADDLAAIFTLGFRGEAVASVASVSKTTILSRVKGEEAYSLTVEGGVFGEVTPAGGAEGTVVTVRDLFYNTPARLKFLKGDAGEEGDITAMMARFLLSRPEISFTYLVNGKVRYRSFGDGLESALAVVYGASAIQNCISIRAEKHGMRLWGYIGNRAYNKPNRSYQSLFLNGRYIVNQTVATAVTNAYGSYLMKRQYPFYVLFLEVPPEVVDVNVHPNKADVRFADNRVVYGTVYSVISAVLDGSSAALEYIVPAIHSTVGENKGSVVAPAQAPAAVSPAKAPVVSVQPATAAPAVQQPAKAVLPEAPAFKAVPKPVETSVSPAAAPKPDAKPAPRMTLEEAKKELSFEIPPMSGREPIHYFEEPKKNVFEVRSPLASAYPSPAAPSEPSPRETSAPQPPHGAAEDAFEENRRFLLERDQRAKQQKIDPASLVYRGVLFETYLIFERGDVAYFIDQHAAHERLIYEKLKQTCEARTPLSQPMLMPYILNVNAQEFSFLVSQFEALRALGFDIDEFGGTSVKVSSVPLDLFGMDLEAFFREVLSSMESLRAIRLSDIVRDKLATMACKAAVKGGERLTEEEAKRLLSDMDGDMGLKCPHGRPAVIQRTKSEFEKLFKRIV
ncbi:MAG TPA: DNA mismatch repair endonuclease MutL [Candidatus Gallimonas intestinavium]|uniref:DNA mismatch repair protein MutL n=1 Tax=Candidatus Gallimonas intestinavium TaxID=2838603 RepID=A0A9D2G6Q8_9FIRM|nr:DNA mismatch repair endonuclease MutL [Candidatus Gallimonas intestinavium]